MIESTARMASTRFARCSILTIAVGLATGAYAQTSAAEGAGSQTPANAATPSAAQIESPAASSSQPSGKSEAAAVVPSNGASSAGLGEIVVTASKRAENLQRAALSLTAVSAAQLQTRGITDVANLAGVAPSVQIQSSFLTLAFIRGVGNYSSQPAVDQSIAFNVDGVYIDRSSGIPNQLFDLERVELLRGPQGTLQGRNATGGSINFITAKPELNEFKGRVSGTFGNYSALTTEGMVNIPFGSDVAIRLSAAHSSHAPYFDNGEGNGNTYGARARLLAKPTDRLSVLASVEYTRRDERGPSVSICPAGSPEPACEGVDYRPFSGTPGQGKDPATNIVEENYIRGRNVAVYADINYDLDFATLTWTPSYRYHTYGSVQTYSPSFGYAPSAHDGMHSQEIRLSSKAGSPFTWVVGGYYGRQRSAEQNYFLTGDAPSVIVSRPGFYTIGHVYFKNDVDKYTYESKSVYGQVTVPLFDGLRLTAGGRFTDDRKKLTGNTGIVVAGPTLIATDVEGRQGTSRFTYKAGLEYDIAPQVMVYGNVSTGFKAGGVNGVPPGSNLPVTFGPETNKAYQGGIKSRFFGNRLQVNAEGFYYDYRGYQTSTFAVTPEGILIGLVANSQKARLYGGEVEASLAITPRDRFDLSVALLDAHYRKFVLSDGTNLSGKRMQNAPGHAITMNYGHNFEMASGGELTAHAEGHYESNQFVNYKDVPGSYVKGFWRANADVTYTTPDKKWSVAAFVKNITNNGSPVVTNGGLGPYTYAVPLPPRTYGVRATANF